MKNMEYYGNQFYLRPNTATLLIIKEVFWEKIEYARADYFLLIGGNSLWYLFGLFPLIFGVLLIYSGLKTILRAANAKILRGGIYLLFRFTDLGRT